MAEKYGGEEGVHKRMQQLGSMGGRKGHNKGFAQNRALASIAGAKGGRASKRKGGMRETIIKHGDYILAKYHSGMSVPQIAKDLGVGYGPLLKWFHDNIAEYGNENDG